MKKHIIISMLLISACASAQVAIGKSSLTTLSDNTTPNPSISLEFGDYDGTTGRGLILPWVTSADDVTGAVEGTVIYDTDDHIIKYKNGTNSWFSLSKNENTTINGTAVDTTGDAVTTLQDNIQEKTEAKAAIGTPATPAVPGILVLEDSNKAMILPKVPSPHLNIVNPEPGTIVYDTDHDLVAVFNGTVWAFWKP